MSDPDKPIVWLHGEVKTPPFSSSARIEAGLLRGGCSAVSRYRCRIRGRADAIVVVDVFEKRTTQAPQHVIDTCRRRLRTYGVGG